MLNFLAFSQIRVKKNPFTKQSQSLLKVKGFPHPSLFILHDNLRNCKTINFKFIAAIAINPADADKEFYGDFLEKVLKDSGVSCGIKEEIPDALEITVRENETEKY